MIKPIEPKHATNVRSASLSRRSFVSAALLTLGSAVLSPAVRAFADEGFSASAATEAALADAQARYEAALDQIAYLNDQVFDAEAAYNDICAALDQTMQAIAELEATIEQREAELAEAQNVLADRLAANYRAGTSGVLELLLNATDFDDLVSRLYYAGKVSDADAEAIQNVKDIKAQLEADRAALREQQAEQERLQAEQAAQLEVLHEQVAQAESYAASLDGEVQALIAQRNAEVAAAGEGAANNGGSEGESGGDYNEGGSSSSGGGSSWGGSSGYQPANVVAAGYNYIGTPYSVLDCSGFTSAAYGDCGYYIPHQSGALLGLHLGRLRRLRLLHPPPVGRPVLHCLRQGQPSRRRQPGRRQPGVLCPRRLHLSRWHVHRRRYDHRLDPQRRRAGARPVLLRRLLRRRQPAVGARSRRPARLKAGSSRPLADRPGFCTNQGARGAKNRSLWRIVQGCVRSGCGRNGRCLEWQLIYQGRYVTKGW